MQTQNAGFCTSSLHQFQADYDIRFVITSLCQLKMEFYDLNKFGILRKVEMTGPQEGNFLFMNNQIFLILFAAFCGVVTSQKCSQFLTVAPVSYLYTKVLQVIHLVQLHGLMNLF